MNTAQKILAEAQKLTARAMEEFAEEKTDGFSDEDTQDRAEAGMKSPGRIMGFREDPWMIKENRTLALVKAVEARTSGDDDHAIIARAGRFLTFLQEGS